jgi:hypothetical protein
VTKERNGPIRGAGRVGFLARQEGIKTMLEAGHPLLAIYQQYEKDMSISYSQFVKYVNKFIRSKPSGNNDRATEKGKDTKKATPIRTRVEQPAFVSSDTPRDRDSLVKRKE